MPIDAAQLQNFLSWPAGRQLRWYLGLLRSGGEGASAADRARYAPGLLWTLKAAATDDEERRAWHDLTDRLGTIVDLSITRVSDCEAVVALSTAKGRKWRLSMAVERLPPHRISKLQWQRQLDSNVEVREATEADGAILAEIERRCPIVRGPQSRYFDRGDDYFAFARLLEDVTVGIALIDGEPAAASCGALHRVRAGGVVYPIVTILHLRVVPEHQRKGLRRAVDRVLDKYWSRVHSSCAYVATDNAAMLRAFANQPNRWSATPLRLQLACADLAGRPMGRRATPADAAAIVGILNACHGGEEMYLPYNVESFRARVERAPRQYSWDRVWMTDRAVVGVWPAGESIKLVVESNDGRVESRRGHVLDYGFLPGGEEDLTGLLRAWCGWLAAAGMDTLLIFTSPASPGSEVLRSLARHSEAFYMWTPGIPEPEGVAARGLYVDQAYF